MRFVGTVACLLAVASANAIRDLRTTLATRDNDPGSRAQLTYPANYFDQVINHFPNNSRYAPYDKGTFKQTYYYDYSYYKPGGPVFLYIGGETSGRSRWSNLQTGIIQILMQETNGLGVILENRYYGTSYPFNDSTTDHLAYLTTEQTIADNAYFAQNAVFPNVTGNPDLTAPGTPWILYGGSLAGAQTAFSIKEYGDVLYGGIASSAPIVVTQAYPDWYDPIQKYGPTDCIARINAIVDNFDALVRDNYTSAIQHFQSLFGLESLTALRDFATTINYPIGNPGFYSTNTWQELNWNSTYGSNDFFAFCGNVTDPDPPESVRELDFALASYTNGTPWDGLGGYADYVKKTVLPLCPPPYELDSNDCFGTHNATYWADTANGGTRSYIYTSCTEQGTYISAPETGPSLLSRVVDTNYAQQWCTWAFPAGMYNSIPLTPDTTQYEKYGGFDFSQPRLAFIDGDQDVWLDLTYHSNFAPSRADKTGQGAESYLITGAGHHWDSYGILDVSAEPQFIREAHRWEIRTVKSWLRDYEEWKAAR
ncbi:extracelular serine carboxypeptidase-like protein [Pseudomassariella vexata]|uniref:Extracelular serine carboxypeptidase-like protein n=1 Tax=Pseudomassariella vexata TaxID=1141098 RepID=A0A1Y2E039_9PEZI|nr:extracelular serine carboxypeptidase-like protein [Pseudomassariella vexata]ORY64857.1 extracelular serine carboxypeptidase-like protein [Pseudomassariella vexata]